MANPLLAPVLRWLSRLHWRRGEAEQGEGRGLEVDLEEEVGERPPRPEREPDAGDHGEEAE